jgi:hypothetical protein
MTRVGITGHQRLDPEGLPWVTKAIREQLQALDPPLIAVTSLAIGADQLLARLVVELGGKIHAVLPFEGIERSFAPYDVEQYRVLLKKAESVEVLHTPGTDEDAYLAAGQHVADSSDVMIAVWNGLPAKGKGGTADVVEYVLMKGKPLIHVNPLSKTVERHPRKPKNWLV